MATKGDNLKLWLLSGAAGMLLAILLSLLGFLGSHLWNEFRSMATEQEAIRARLIAIEVSEEIARDELKTRISSLEGRRR